MMKWTVLLAAAAATNAFIVPQCTQLRLPCATARSPARRYGLAGVRAQEQRKIPESEGVYAMRIQPFSSSRDFWKILAPAIPTGAFLSQIALPVQVDYHDCYAR